LLGFISSDDPGEFAARIRAQKEGGAVHINVQMDNHDTPPALATRHWIRLVREAERIGGVVVSLEVHRDTCTETPEKTYEIAERYQRATGEMIKINFDFSHFAVVKHLSPGDYAARLLDHPDLVQNSEQCHFRPFNGHHCQVPVTHDGRLTPEVRSYLAFARAVMKLWRSASSNRNRTLYACPEMGPLGGAAGGGAVTTSRACRPHGPTPWRCARKSPGCGRGGRRSRRRDPAPRQLPRFSAGVAGGRCIACLKNSPLPLSWKLSKLLSIRGCQSGSRIHA